MTIIGIVILAVFTWTQRAPEVSTTGSHDEIAEAFGNRTSKVQVSGVDGWLRHERRTVK